MILVKWGGFSGLPGPWRLAMCEWFRKHGIDPTDVVVPGWVEIDDAARTITYRRYVRDAQGRVQLDPTRKLESLKDAFTVQLESPALPLPETPFPPGFGYYVARHTDNRDWSA